MIEQLIGWAAFAALVCLGGWSDHQAREHWLRRPYLRSTVHSSERPFNPALYRAPRTGPGCLAAGASVIAAIVALYIMMVVLKFLWALA